MNRLRSKIQLIKQFLLLAKLAELGDPESHSLMKKEMVMKKKLKAPRLQREHALTPENK